MRWIGAVFFLYTGLLKNCYHIIIYILREKRGSYSTKQSKALVLFWEIEGIYNIDIFFRLQNLHVNVNRSVPDVLDMETAETVSSNIQVIIEEMTQSFQQYSINGEISYM